MLLKFIETSHSLFLLIFHKLVLLVRYFHHTSHFNGALTSRGILRYKSSPNNSFRNDLPFPQGLCLASATSSVLFLVNPSPKINSTASFQNMSLLGFLLNSSSVQVPRSTGAACRAADRGAACAPSLPTCLARPPSLPTCLARPASKPAPGLLLLGFHGLPQVRSLGNDRKQGLPALTHCPIWVFERFDQSQKISV